MRTTHLFVIAGLIVAGLCFAEENSTPAAPAPAQPAAPDKAAEEKAAQEKAAQEKAAKEAAEKMKWHGSAALGLTVNKGNTDSTLFNLAGDAAKLLKHDEYRLGADTAYGTQRTPGVGSKTSASNAHAFADYKHLFVFSDRFFAGAHLDVLHDDVNEIRYRGTLGPDVGYYFIKNDKTKLSGDVGPTFVTEKVDGNRKSYAAVRVSERGEHQVTKTWKVWESADYLFQLSRRENYTLTAQLGSESALTTILSLRLTLTDKYENEPAPGKKHNDATFIAAAVLHF